MAEKPVPGSEARPTSPGAKIETILPEKPTIQNGYAVVGHLKIEAAQYDKVREALKYEGKNPETATVVQNLVNGPKTTTITTNAQADNSMRPLANGNAEVHWDPSKMHIAANGAERSPATRLGHELDHAEEWTHNPQRLIKNAQTPDAKYGNLEEKRVITGWERRTVHELGEGVRTDHDYGKGNFEVSGVTSHTPVLHAKVSGHDTTLHNGFSQDGKITAITADKVVQSIGHGQTVEYNRRELEAFVDPNKLQNSLATGQSVHIGVHDGKFQDVQTQAQTHQQPSLTH